MEDLAHNYDVVVIGTGPSEALVSGALAEAKKTLINFDKNGEYGGCRRTFNIRDFKEFIPKIGGEIIVDRVEEVLGKEFRASIYNIDLMPMVFYANDDLIQVLIDSQSSDAVRITTIDGLYFPGQGQFRNIPCSKQSIFTDKSLGLPQKRAAMNFITAFLPEEQYGHITKHQPTVDLINEYMEKPFSELLKAAKFDQDLSLAFEYFVACATEPILTKDAIPKIKTFIESIGRYCATPFITFIYGAADVPQVFDRHSAVYGGIFVLKHTPESIEKKEDGTFVLKVPQIGEVTTKTLIIGGDQVEYPEGTPKRVLANREVILCKESLVPASRSIIVIPPGRYNNDKPVWIFQFDSSTQMCGNGEYLYHFVSQGDVKSTADRLLELNPSIAESVILRAAFQLSEPEPSPIEGAYFLQSPSASDFIVGSNYFVNQAKETVKKISEDIPFYPPPKEVEIDVPITEETKTNENKENTEQAQEEKQPTTEENKEEKAEETQKQTEENKEEDNSKEAQPSSE